MSPQTDYEIEVVTPYRLDLTVSVLRRSSRNIVDLFTRNGEYVRAVPVGRDHVTAYVRQTSARSLLARFEGDGNHDEALATVRRILGVDRDISRFERTAKRLPWLRSLAIRMRGVKPPRYPTLWEACVNAILFQQISLASASAVMRRFTLLFAPEKLAGSRPYAFPSVDRFADINDDVVRTAGLSGSKLETLRRVAGALRSGVLDEASLEALPSPEATAVLRGVKGIGPWTATVILLRGLGRLDAFPMNDSSVQHNLAVVAGGDRVDLVDALDMLGPERGMLYYYLLLARLDARDDIGRISSSFSD